MATDEKTGVLERRKLNVRERRQDIWIAKLRRQNCFDRLVKKLVGGASVSRVTRWLHDLKPEGELKNCSSETLRIYVTALANRVKENMAFVKRSNVEPLAFRLVLREMEKQKGAVIDDDPPMSKAAKKVLKEVSDAVKKLDAETMLKYAYMVQQGRVEMLLKMENQMNLLMPDGWKNIAVLKDIAAEVRKCEVGEQWMRGKAGAAYGGPYPGGLLPHPEAPEKELSPMAQRLSQLDAIDRNLIRAATSHVMELIQEEIRASSHTKGLEGNAEERVAAETEMGNPDVGPVV